MYLKPLKSTIEALEESEFDQLEPRLAPVLHTLCLVWAHSTHYRMPSRIIVVLQEICNLLIRIVSFSCTYIVIIVIIVLKADFKLVEYLDTS